MEQTLSILVLEDEIIVAENIAAILRNMDNFTVFLADNSERAV